MTGARRLLTALTNVLHPADLCRDREFSGINALDLGGYFAGLEHFGKAAARESLRATSVVCVADDAHVALDLGMVGIQSLVASC